MKATQRTHTPGKIKVGSEATGTILSASGSCIAICYSDVEATNDAARIVRCWNHHDDLLKQRDALKAACERYMREWRDIEADYKGTPLESVADVISAALALCGKERVQ